MSDSQRTFIAIPIPEAIKEALAVPRKALLEMKKRSDARLSIPKLENLHLTLRFLGDTPPNKLADISEAIGKAIGTATAFNITVGNIGAFPNWKRPRTIWAGLRAPKQLFDLQRAIHESVAGFPIQADNNNFKPHLTLARVKSTNSHVIAQCMSAFLNESFGEFEASEIILFQSELNPSGAIYTPLAGWKLERA